MTVERSVGTRREAAVLLHALRASPADTSSSNGRGLHVTRWVADRQRLPSSAVASTETRDVMPRSDCRTSTSDSNPATGPSM